jgi:hypothetical protein
MATKMFKGKESKAEESSEARAVKSGKISPKQYAKGEKSEGHARGAMDKGKALKSGALSVGDYIKGLKAGGVPTKQDMGNMGMKKGGKVKKFAGGGDLVNARLASRGLPPQYPVTPTPVTADSRRAPPPDKPLSGQTLVNARLASRGMPQNPIPVTGGTIRRFNGGGPIKPAPTKDDGTPSAKEQEEMRKMRDEAREQKARKGAYNAASSEMKFAKGGGIECKGKTKGKFR